MELPELFTRRFLMISRLVGSGHPFAGSWGMRRVLSTAANSDGTTTEQQTLSG